MKHQQTCKSLAGLMKLGIPFKHHKSMKTNDRLILIFNVELLPQNEIIINVYNKHHSPYKLFQIIVKKCKQIV